LARRKRQPEKPKKARLPKAGPGPIVRLIRRIPPAPVVKTIIFIALLTLAGYGLATIDNHVRQSDVFRLRDITLVWPKWCPQQLVQHLHALPQPFAKSSIYNEELCDKIKTVYEHDAWVRRVISVRKQFPDRVIVEVDVRKPEFIVDKGRRERFLVDRDGCLLPPEYERWVHSNEVKKLQFIKGVATQPPPVPGSRWFDRSLMAGIETLAYIADRGYAANSITIHGADVSNFDCRISPIESEIVLLAANDNRIQWGRHPCTEKIGEAPPDVKLKYLEELLKQNPNVGGKAFSVRFAEAGTQAMRQNRNAAEQKCSGTEIR